MTCKHFTYDDWHCFHQECRNYFDRCPRHGYDYSKLVGGSYPRSALYAVDGRPDQPCMGPQ